MTPTLTFDRTVPRELTHRRALGEVFVTDSAEDGPDAFAVAIQIPRAHSLWFDRPASHHDPLATVEASRQATFVVVHRHLGVPQGPPFILQDIAFRVVSLEAYRDDAASPLEGVYRFRLHDREQSGGALVGLRFDARLEVGEDTALEMRGAISFLRQPDYDALRAFGRARKPLAAGGERSPRPAPLDPSLRARRDVRNVVIGEPHSPNGDGDGAARFPVIVDETHPSFYDHPQDHVPGPLLLEAFRQAGIAVALRAGALPSPDAALTATSTSFSDFAEPEGISECAASVVDAGEDGRVALALTLHQFGKQIASADIELTELP